MPRFFVDCFDAARPTITGEDAHHIGFSLRMRPGEQLTVCADAVDYTCEIAEITRDAVLLRLLSQAPSAGEPDISLTLYQALPKLDKLEQIVQKAVELGAQRVVPVLTARCISRCDKQTFEKKRERLQKIARGAAMQAGRGRIPQVSGLYGFAEAVNELAAMETGLMLYEGGGERLSTLQFGHEIGLLVGSEGGFSPDEALAAAEAGVKNIWLGSRILRCETAPLAAISVVMHRTGNL